jgi:acyl-CoA thioester hydrolase
MMGRVECTQNVKKDLDRPRIDHFPKIVSISTRWSDNDAYRHVNNVVYFSFFDTAVNQNLIEHGLLDVERSPVVGLVVDNQCQYFASLAFPDEVKVGIKVIQLGNSSVQYLLGIFKNAEPTICALGKFTHVYVDRESNKPVSIPLPIREMLEKIR